MSKYQHYSHSVVDVCMRLHGCDTGSGDGMPDDERRELVEWLRWRTTEGWQNHHSFAPQIDSAVLELAIAVLNLADDKDSDCDNEPSDAVRR